MARFSDLLRKSARWFGLASILLFIFLIPAGLLFFLHAKGDSAAVSWRIPWILAVLGTGINLFTVPFYAVILGSGDVVTINQRELAGAVLGSLISWIAILLGGGLYTIFLVAFGNIAVAWTYLCRQKPELVRKALSGGFRHSGPGSGGATISWKDEIWPLQWKTAITWGAGFLVFQLFNPIIFHYHGAVTAGRMGLTLAAMNAIVGVGLTFQNAKIPEFGKRIALRRWAELDRLFFGSLAQSFLIVVAGAVAGTVFIGLLQAYHPLGQRFLPYPQAGLLFATGCVQIAINGFAVYLRAHKEEPLAFISVMVGVLYALAIWYLGKNHGPSGAALGFFLTTAFVAAPLMIAFWRKLRNEWHT